MPTQKEKSAIEDARDTIWVLNHLPIPALTPQEVIEHGLLLAKPSPTDEEMTKAAVFYHYTNFASGTLRQHLEMSMQPATVRKWWADNESQRTSFRARLAELVLKPQQAIREAKNDWKQLDREMLITVGIDQDTGETTHKFFPLTVEAGYKYVLQALCNRDRDRWKRLRQCGYSECQAFFYRKPSKSGGRPRDYCTSECQELNDQKGPALIRQKEQRRKRKQGNRGTS